MTEISKVRTVWERVRTCPTHSAYESAAHATMTNPTSMECVFYPSCDPSPCGSRDQAHLEAGLK